MTFLEAFNILTCFFFFSLGWGLTLTFLPWGDQWKAHRALLQKGFTKSNVLQYQELQEQEARQAAWSIGQKSSDWERLLRRQVKDLDLETVIAHNCQICFGNCVAHRIWCHIEE